MYVHYILRLLIKYQVQDEFQFYLLRFLYHLVMHLKQKRNLFLKNMQGQLLRIHQLYNENLLKCQSHHLRQVVGQLQKYLQRWLYSKQVDLPRLFYLIVINESEDLKSPVPDDTVPIMAGISVSVVLVESQKAFTIYLVSKLERMITCNRFIQINAFTGTQC
ncbi:unnamed protein product [Paramecium sonneborni]|uniref:Uncharacterized protein n=1 Tax=Paramecium sonneborni TaxID=65129 RepID=A0A8S1M0V5_9CILI|nr:unnamed protein product [Paramecium sonneborni]